MVLQKGITKEYTEEELIFEMGEENFKEFVKEYMSYIQ